MQARFLHFSLEKFLTVQFTFGKTGESLFVYSVGKVYLCRTSTNGLGRWPVLLKKYEPVTKDHCPGVLNCSSKGRKSISMLTLVVKQNTFLTEHFLVAASFSSNNKIVKSGTTQTNFMASFSAAREASVIASLSIFKVKVNKIILSRNKELLFFS